MEPQETFPQQVSDAGQAKVLKASSTLTAIGFWLPCGRTNFYDPNTDGFQGTPTSPVPSTETTPPSLESSVCKRLRDVLPTRGYTQLTQLYPFDSPWLKSEAAGVNRSDPTENTGFEDPKRVLPRAANDDNSSQPSFPDAILFATYGQPPSTFRTTFSKDLPSPIDIDNWPVEVPIDGLLFLATMFGFYYIVAKHDAGMDPQLIIRALRSHATSLMGGHFYSHFSGREERSYFTHHEADGEISLKAYQDQHLGILNFFQINSLIEGLFNSHFDPPIFFRERSQEQDDYNKAKQKYTIGLFADMIVVNFDPDGPSRDGDLLVTTLLNGEGTYADMDRYRHWLHDDNAKQALLRGFLDKTASLCLRRPLKLTIERCRRALLGKMLDVTHRRDRIIQAESPREDAEQILSENEDQLRGYVMLVSAKLPIIKNIANHLEEQSEEDKFSKSDIPALKSSLRAWTRLFQSLTDNVHEIERAIEQFRLDRSLHEQAQMRAEQETAAELDRVRIRFGLNSTGGSKWELPGIVGQWLGIAIAFMALVISYFTINGGGQKYIDIIFGGTLLIIIICLVFPFALQWLKARRDATRYLAKPENDEFHYEFDFHLNVPMEQDDARDLNKGAFDNARKRRGDEQYENWKRKREHEIEVHERKSDEHVGGGFMLSKEWADELQMQFSGESYLHTYRVDRLSDEEATFKIHAEATVEDLLYQVKPLSLMERVYSLLGLRQAEPQKMVISLVYELLAHLPSANHHCILRDVRVIALKNSPLSIHERTRLQLFVIRRCINVFIKRDDDRIKTDRESLEHDPSLYLDRIFSE